MSESWPSSQLDRMSETSHGTGLGIVGLPIPKLASKTPIPAPTFLPEWSEGAVRDDTKPTLYPPHVHVIPHDQYPNSTSPSSHNIPHSPTRKNVCYISFGASDISDTPAIRSRSIRSRSDSLTTPVVIAKLPSIPIQSISSPTPETYSSGKIHSSQSLMQPPIATVPLSHNNIHHPHPPSPLTSSESPRQTYIQSQINQPAPQPSSYKTFSAASQFKLSPHQRKVLERIFQETEAPTNQQYHQISDRLRMPRSAVMAWFQNMRSIVRKYGQVPFHEAAQEPPPSVQYTAQIAVRSPSAASSPSLAQTLPAPETNLSAKEGKEDSPSKRPYIMSVMALI
ncbi:hypothetical protein BCR33DRAFT_779635 [Rhizoclosmatium globosum]|uniref:Homeobox domain-containing protein n=1 Tax=Rhizoclosmatium globosum TaxID=329046 RepID=A0A1Y2CZC5_9FUNG|nr:hypothetical protein BCR33DRAFT_779635 [Rhizoclosmatium globosum]|eukprot:ORY52307.1 hypothetical protein BCR33DRAFT_779635 [Rhizoclosmatium globosum]